MSSKITIKRSTTAVPPAGLSFGEMAFVQGTGLTANQLYVGISGGSPVWVGAQISTTGSWTDTAARTSLATQYAIDQRISSQISGGSPITTVSDNTNTTRYLVFGSTAGAGVTLFVDDTTGPLSYNPSLGTLTVAGDLNVNGGDILTTQTTATLFSSTVTNLGIGLAASTLNIGGSTGSFTIKNPELTVGASGITGTIFADDANLILTTKNWDGVSADPADSPAKIIINPEISAGFVNIEGSDLRLGNKTKATTVSGVNIVFEGTTNNANRLTLTAADPASSFTVTLPHATDTLVGKLTTDTFTNKTFDTAGTGNVFRIAGVTLSGVTGTGSVVLSTSPAITTSLIAGSTTFALLNTTATTVNFAGAATALNMGVLGGTATFAGALTVAGNLTVNGTTTTLNSTTLTVDDKNIEMGVVGEPTVDTADGGGIILKGDSDKSILWDKLNTNFTSNQHWNLPTGKLFKINNATVLSSSALGSGVTGSSLTQVGTITSGTWSGSFGAVSGANLTVLTAGGLTGTIPSGVLGNSSLNIGTTSIALNRTSASQTLTGVSIDGSAGSATTAGSATNATNATNVAITTENSDVESYITFVTTNSSGNQAVKVSNQLQYNAQTGELSATLIDGGSF
jgi:hypothetical protein